MKRFKLLGLALVAVFALTAAFSASAFALPELLGWSNANFEGESTAANPTLETVKEEKIVCKAAKAEGTQEGDTLGTFHIHFTGCESSGFKCNTSGDESGIILALGTFHFVWDILTPELGVAILFLPEEQNIKCTALVTLKVKGSIICLILLPLESLRDHEFHCTQTGGKPSEKTYWNDEGAEATAQALTSKNGGTFIESAEQALALVLFDLPVAFMTD